MLHHFQALTVQKQLGAGELLLFIVMHDCALHLLQLPNPLQVSPAHVPACDSRTALLCACCALCTPATGLEASLQNTCVAQAGSLAPKNASLLQTEVSLSSSCFHATLAAAHPHLIAAAAGREGLVRLKKGWVKRLMQVDRVQTLPLLCHNRLT